MKLVISLYILIGMVLLFFNCKERNNSFKPIQNSNLKESITRGRDIYKDFCISCHLPSGQGVKHIYPPLANSDYLKNNRLLSIRAVKYGQKGKIVVNGKTFDNFMPPMGLEDEEIADVMNYINHSWNNDYGDMVTPEEVTNVSKK